MTLTQVDRVVSVHGLKLHYRETRETSESAVGRGVPVVALHGHPGTAATWDAVAGALCAGGDGARGDGRASRFLALTQRGYGLSARASSYAYGDFAADVHGFAEALGLDAFVLLGHSFGGTIASLAAGLDPARLLGLVLEDSVLPRDPRPGRFPEPPPGELPYDRDLVSAIGSQFADPDPAWWASLARIACRTLIICGGSTSHVPQKLLADAAELIPHARAVTLEGAGHTAHRTQPDRFAAQVRAFLGELAAGA
jgi:pimeloyl-ACP methyl ester carboxylesterase